MLQTPSNLQGAEPLTLDRHGEKIGCVLDSPALGDVSHIVFRVGAVRGGSWILEVSLQTVDADYPSGTFQETGSRVEVEVSEGDQSVEVSLPKPARIAHAGRMAVVLTVVRSPEWGSIVIDPWDNARDMRAQCIQIDLGTGWTSCAGGVLTVLKYKETKEGVFQRS
jgi:hypothetical protein